MNDDGSRASDYRGFNVHCLGPADDGSDSARLAFGQPRNPELESHGSRYCVCVGERAVGRDTKILFPSCLKTK